MKVRASVNKTKFILLPVVIKTALVFIINLDHKETPI